MERGARTGGEGAAAGSGQASMQGLMAEGGSGLLVGPVARWLPADPEHSAAQCSTGRRSRSGAG